MDNQSKSFENIIQIPPPNEPNPYNSIDRVTLELMSNKNQYNKYLSKTNPLKYKENKEHIEKVNKYSKKIEALTSDLLQNPSKEITNDINDAFNDYVRICIKYFEMKELDNISSYNYDNYSDSDDMMFGKMDEENTYNDTSTTSYWGKSIRKLGPKYTLDSFVTKK
jgi:hypothetical protein